MKKRIVLISCVSKKLMHAAKTKDMYISTLFKSNLKYAQQLLPDGIFVLSAEYDLLDLEQRIAPYDKTLNNMSPDENKQWASRVINQIKELFSIDETEFVFLAGEKYRRNLLPHIKHSTTPLEGLRIGEQLQKLKQLTS